MNDDTNLTIERIDDDDRLTAIEISEAAAFQERVLVFLDDLRERGITNMFGAAPYIEAEFDLTRSEAETLLKYWMRTFSERHPQE